jgi:hypothetical protein
MHTAGYWQQARAVWAIVSCLTMLSLAPADGIAGTPAYDSAPFFTAAPVQGQPIGQIFSRTISTQVSGFDWSVKRISGTGRYRLTSASKDHLLFDSEFDYDGSAPQSGITKLRLDGSESCWKDDCGQATDASGLLFNSLIWGTPPKRISVGTHWRTTISIPWELGPPGDEEVTVMALNALTGSVTLLRKGSGEGPFNNDPMQLKLTAKDKQLSLNMKGGKAHWSGYATIEKGIVVSDELLVERGISLSSDETGNIAGFQRQYILLNKMPSS